MSRHEYDPEKVYCPSSIYVVGVLTVMLKGAGLVWWIFLLGASWAPPGCHPDTPWCLLGVSLVPPWASFEGPILEGIWLKRS